MAMSLHDFIRSNYQAWEDDKFMVVKGHSEMHGEPILSVTDFAHPEAGAKVYRNRDDVEKRLSADRAGEVS